MVVRLRSPLLLDPRRGGLLVHVRQLVLTLIDNMQIKPVHVLSQCPRLAAAASRRDMFRLTTWILKPNATKTFNLFITKICNMGCQ